MEQYFMLEMILYTKDNCKFVKERPAGAEMRSPSSSSSVPTTCENIYNIVEFVENNWISN